MRNGISIARAIRLLDLFVRLISFDLFTRLIPLRGLGAWRSSVYQVTLHIAQDLLSHSLFVRLILWSADAGRDRLLST